MHSNKLNLALIYGSTRQGRFCDTIAQWATEEISRDNALSLDVIDPLHIDLPPRLGAANNKGLGDLKVRIGRADAILIVTPEYNHGYPAAVKAVIDSVYAEWRAKPVAFVSYGGVSGGLRAVEQLRLVFAELHATTIRDTVSFANAWNLFDDTGHLHEPEPARSAMEKMLAGLKWWAAVLRDGRLAAEYPADRAA